MAGLALGSAVAAGAGPRDTPPLRYACHYTATPIRVDGRLDDPAWAKAEWTTDFVDIEGAGKPKPRFRTRAKMLWDAKYLYIAAEMEEPDVHATLTEHDSVIFRDDDFEVFVKPLPKTASYYEFEMNALNTGWDLFLPKPYKMQGKPDNSWGIQGLEDGGACGRDAEPAGGCGSRVDGGDGVSARCV